MSCSGAKIVIVGSLLIHFLWIETKYFILLLSSVFALIPIASFETLTYLSFPVVGYGLLTHGLLTTLSSKLLVWHW